jgi:hypothetical protein
MNDVGFVPCPDRAEETFAVGGLLARAAELLRRHVTPEAPPYLSPVDLGLLLEETEPRAWEAFEGLVEVFALSRAEAGLLVALASISTDPVLAAGAAAIQGQGRTGLVSFTFARRLLPELELAALRPDGPLRSRRLIELEPPPEAAAATLFRIDDRLLYHLAGVAVAADLLVEIEAPGWLAPSQQEIASRLASLLEPSPGITAPVVQLRGEDPGTLRSLAAAAAGALGRKLFALSAPALPMAHAEIADLAQRANRDLLLCKAVLLVEAPELPPDGQSCALQFAELVEIPVMIASRTPLPLRRRAFVRLDVPPPSFAERRMHWKLLAPGIGEGALDRLARTFLLDGAGRASAARLAGPDIDSQKLWDACRSLSREGLEGLAERVSSSAGWDELVLPETQCGILREIVDHVGYAGLVFEQWQFETRLNRGCGVAALFAGPSGTGKTLAAEVLANALERDLYRIDLSQVVSKYIGETEKNLARIFAAAESGGAILLFDEADALFGKRSEVQDSHDRYANIEVSYLLQRMETYNGLSILTTNLKDALDKAFFRRLRFIVQFAYPNADQRRQIWSRAFPAALPTQSLDYARLGQYDLTGGAIRNVALAAAFLAARDGGPLTMAHCAAAATREYQKLEKPLGALGTERRR